MEDKNLNQRIKPNRNEPTDEARQPIPDDRYFNISISPYLHIFTPPNLCAYLCPPACLPISVPIQAYKHVTTITQVYLPPPLFGSVKILVAFLQFFFEFFF